MHSAVLKRALFYKAFSLQQAAQAIYSAPREYLRTVVQVR